MADYKLELSEKDELVSRLREIVESMKTRLNKTSPNGEKAAFYEQQSVEKDIIISVN